MVNDYNIMHFPIYKDFLEKLAYLYSHEKHYIEVAWAFIVKSFLDYKNNTAKCNMKYLHNLKSEIDEKDLKKLFNTDKTKFALLLSKLYNTLINYLNFGEIHSLRKGFYIISMEFVKVL
jgi:hypothetical protein